MNIHQLNEAIQQTKQDMDDLYDLLDGDGKHLDVSKVIDDITYLEVKLYQLEEELEKHVEEIYINRELEKAFTDEYGGYQLEV